MTSSELGKVKESHGDQILFITTGRQPVSYGQIVKMRPTEGAESKAFHARVSNAGSRSTLEEVPGAPGPERLNENHRALRSVPLCGVGSLLREDNLTLTKSLIR